MTRSSASFIQTEISFIFSNVENGVLQTGGLKSADGIWSASSPSDQWVHACRCRRAIAAVVAPSPQSYSPRVVGHRIRDGCDRDGAYRRAQQHRRRLVDRRRQHCTSRRIRPDVERGTQVREPQAVPTAAAAGVAVWLLACTIPSFYATPAARAALMAAIGMSYTLLTVRELWRSRGDGLLSRWPIIALLTLHAAILPTRIPLVAAWAGAEPIQTNLLTFIFSVHLSQHGGRISVRQPGQGKGCLGV